ncbi:putative F-box domain-containing protein [Tanacetum coccineum]
MVMFDVIEAILLRCLVKDALRSKSVCKSWYSLISSPSFAKTHANFICNKEEDNPKKIAMITSYLDVSGRQVKVRSGWSYYSKWSMEGSCNGLVCIYSGARIFVTNPVTREFREIQQAPKRTPKEMQCLGFGYDSSSDDYKVVLAICQQGKALVQILSLKSNVWKPFGHVNYIFDDSLLAIPGILFNGALHWFWLNPNDATRQNILLVSFDLAKEEFREIPQPHDSRYVWNYGYSLGIIQGRLCIFPAYDEDDFPSCGIWVMKSYNSYSWELLPHGSEMKDHAIHYMLKDSNEYRITPPPTYFCDENIQLSRNKEHIRSPMFVQTLVTPHVNNNNCGPSHAKNNKSIQCWEC